jgi:hypothetical protein
LGIELDQRSFLGLLAEKSRTGYQNPGFYHIKSRVLSKNLGFMVFFGEMGGGS